MKPVAPRFGAAILLALACGCDSATYHKRFGNGGPDLGATDDAAGPACAVHCSADLHNLIDCNDNLVLACPPDQGCSPDGTCVAPCDAAKSNQSTVGCDYFSVDPGTDGESNGSCFAVYIAN